MQLQRNWLERFICFDVVFLCKSLLAGWCTGDSRLIVGFATTTTGNERTAFSVSSRSALHWYPISDRLSGNRELLLSLS